MSKVLANGRNAAPHRAALKPKIAGLFVPRTLAMLESPAWRALPDNARRVLERVEIEHMRRGRGHNGALICTYDELVEWGLRRASIKLALMQCEALGFLKVTRQGYAARMEVRVPSLYLLTYVEGNDGPSKTDDWQNIDERQAKLALKRVLATRDEGKEERERNRRRRAPGA